MPDDFKRLERSLEAVSLEVRELALEMVRREEWAKSATGHFERVEDALETLTRNLSALKLDFETHKVNILNKVSTRSAVTSLVTSIATLIVALAIALAAGAFGK